MIPVLSVTGLSISRSGTPILQGVHWQVNPGEHWVILGANGSGKTSLLSALTGYLPPTEGAFRVLGEEFGASDWRELRKHIGLVSSSISQMVPGEEEALTTVISGKSAMLGHWGRIQRGEREEALHLLEQVEGAHLAERPWRVLSQGERQRVLIARALMAEPSLLILDEPCAGLDPVSREGFLHFLDRLGQMEGAPALVLVTHHVEEIMPVFTHALLLREGRVCASGERARVLTSAHLGAAFGTEVRLRQRAGRLALRFP